MSRLFKELRALPYPEQIAAIDQAIGSGQSYALVEELSSYRDFQPLAYALAGLGNAGILSDAERTLIPLLLGIADTGLRRVLRALDGVAVPASFTRALAAGCWELPIERLAAVAMLDRWLKNTAPHERESRAQAGLARCRAQLEAGRPETIGDAELMRLPGSAMAMLGEVASTAGATTAWLARQHRFASKTLDVLEDQPKSLSQANAEELLARQVYTDPGHFLVELLQNADDAGARLWRVEVFPDRIEVTHDGAPFNALDVVGILSIGQTTKSKEQIGFFGVGFKSVYEICERPQLYSGLFSLEIADVSIPRPLRPLASLPTGHTRLVLPLRTERDEHVSPAKLFQTLEELPAEVVLTLGSVRELDLRYQELRRHVHGQEEADGRFCITDGGRGRRYLVERDQAHYPGDRGAHRANRTPVLVAIALSPNGIPVPSTGAPTIYSYLPTNERSGLRFLVHAHFDLPVDRERLDLSSAWNQWALAHAGTLLAKIVGMLCRELEASAPLASERLDAIVDVLSLPSELGHEAFAAVASALGELEFLAGANGDRHAPKRALLSGDHHLREAFAEVPLQGGRMLLAQNPGHRSNVALWLGAQVLAPSSVVECMTREGLQDGARYGPAWGPFLANFAEALTAEAEVSPLRDVPSLPSHDGRAQRPGSLRRAAPMLRTFLKTIQPLVREDLEKCPAFLDALGVPVSRVRDLVEQCCDINVAEALIAEVGAPELIRYLQAAPPAELELVPLAHLVPNHRGGHSAVGEVWMSGTSAMASLIRRTPSALLLVRQNIEELLAPELRRLGCRTLDVPALLDLIDQEVLTFPVETLVELHVAISDIAGEISPQVASRLARTAFFPTNDESVRSLRGMDTTNIPYDIELPELWSSPSWLHPEVAALPYVRTLGAPVLGPEQLAEALLQAQEHAPRRRDAFAYIAQRAAQISSLTAEVLATSSLWPDAHGTLQQLGDLRRPAQQATVAKLYSLWPQAMTIEAGEAPGSAMHLAAALHLGHLVVTPDYTTALSDLQAKSAVDGGPYRNASTLDLDTPEVATIVTAVLNEAAEALPRTTLSIILQAPIFRCTDGQRRRLGTAARPSRDRALRVDEALGPAFESLGFARLDAGTVAELAPLLNALLLRPATLVDLVRESSDGSLSEASARQFRSALTANLSGLATLDEEARYQLSGVAMWPFGGALACARDVVPRHTFAAKLARAGISTSDLELASLPLLDATEDEDAQALAPFLSFASPLTLLVRIVETAALPGEPLHRQPEFLSTPSRVAALAASLISNTDSPWTLPISVNARGHLVARPLLLATQDELVLASGLSLADGMAHPEWADGMAAKAHGLSQLEPRRLLDALREVSGDAVRASEHQALAKEEQRAALYRWLVANAETLAADEQCIGLLGKCAVLHTTQGVLRSPRELLFDESLPDLGIDWNPSDEVCEELRAWLREQYRPASRQLRPIVDHMLAATSDAADAGDGNRLEAVLAHLALVLRAESSNEDLEELAKRFKLRKRLRVETDAGTFDFARRLLAAAPVDADLVPRFSKEPPPSVARRYQHPHTLRLLRASGAEDELGLPALRGYLEGSTRREGDDASLALACYLASAVVRQPSLKSELALLRTAWVPNALGALCSPTKLYWPTHELGALIGRDDGLFAHPEFVLRAPRAREWLPLRDVRDAALADVVSFLINSAAQGEPAGSDALLWLDEGLAAKRFRHEAVYTALANTRMLMDDHGALRRPSELIVAGGRQLFGHRRGSWSAGARFRHLSEALGVSRRPEVRDVVAILREVQEEYEVHPEQTATHPETLELLPRCLDFLAESGARGPSSLPVTAMYRGSATLLLLPADEESVALPTHAEDADYVLRLAEGADPHVWSAYLRRYGIGGDVLPEERCAANVGDDPEEHQSPPAQSPAENTAQNAAEEGGPGVLSRLRKWLRSSDDEADDGVAPRPSTSEGSGRRPGAPSGGGKSRSPQQPAEADPPFRPVDQRSWFRSESRLSPQLASNPSWLADRTRVAEFGLAHAPHQLPLPHRYAPNAIFDSFDRSRQQWRPMRADRRFREGAAVIGRLHMRGKLPSPEARVPMPLYSTLLAHHSEGASRIVDGKDFAALLSKEDTTVSFTVGHTEAPNFSESTKGESHEVLIEPCVADGELPAEVLDLVESLRNEESALRITGVVRSFVRSRYVYDPSYLEDPQMAAWLQERSAGRSNLHIAALHAGGDVKYLGRGVCYELNSLVCEMLRRCGVAAGVATGWTFDRGHIDEPDHLWAMALVQTTDGPKWLPVDASTTQNGRPLHAAHRPPGPWRPDKRKAKSIPSPDWDSPVEQDRAIESLPLGDLLRVARYLENATGRHLGSRGELLAACRDTLSDPMRREALTTLLSGVAGSDEPET